MIPITWSGRLLHGLVRVATAQPLVTVAVSLALAVAALAWTFHALAFKTSGRDLLPQDAPYVVSYNEYARDFGELDDIVVVVDAHSFEAAKAYASRLVHELRSSPVTFHRIAYRIDPKRFEGQQLLYLSTERLEEIRDRIFDHQEFMERFAEDPSLAQLVEGVNAQIASAFVENLFDLGLRDTGSPVDTRFLRTLLDQIGARLERPTPYRSPWGSLFSVGDIDAEAGYFLSEDRSLLFVLVEPPKAVRGGFLADQQIIDTVRDAIARLKPLFPTVQAGVTGVPALNNDEMTAAFADSQTATLLAFALTLLVMALAFARLGKPLLMLVVLAVTLAWSMGVTTLTVGHLTIFSVMFISIVIGIGIDYGIYFLFRYKEEIYLGRSLREALQLTAARSGPGMLMGALTAGGAFYVLMLTDFRGIQELGFIAGTAILLAWLGMMTLFPALLVLVDRRHAKRPHNQEPRAHALERVRVPILERLAGHPTRVLVAAGLFTAAALWALPHVAFDYNLLNLQPEGTESVVWERRILATTGRSGFNGLASADSLEELRKKHTAFERLPSVSGVDSVLHLIPDRQADKIGIIKSFAPLVEPVRVSRSRPVDMDRLLRAVGTLRRRFEVARAESKTPLPQEVQELHAQADDLLRRLASTERELAEAALSHLQAQLYRDFVDKFHSLQRNLHPRPIGAEDAPEEIRRKFIGQNGRFLIQIHPEVNIWERPGAEQFVTELRSVDPAVTGPPIITYEAIRFMERAYLQGTIYAFVLVAGLTLLMIRRLRETMLALLPLALALVWTVGLMRLFGLQFTLANVWGLPLIIGTSAEFGLNVVMRYLEDREQGGPLVARSTAMAVTLNGLTTIVGFGSLMVAAHRGIFGLGLLLTIGAACALAASLVVVPVVLRMLPRPERSAPAPARAPTEERAG